MTTASIVWIVGRILFGGYFAWNGFNHLKNIKGMTGYAASKGVPMPKLAVGVTGVLLLLGGLGVVFNYMTMLALIFLVIFLIPVTFTMHAFWKETDPMQKMHQQVGFMKNVALLGAVIILLSPFF